MISFIHEFDVTIFFIAMILGFIGGFFDNSFGMGYGLLTPIFLLLGFDPLVVVPTLLLSQAITGFSGTIFHYLYKNVDFSSASNRESKVFGLFTFMGIIGTILAIFIAFSFSDLVMLLYIGSMMVIVGFIVLFKINFNGSWNKLYLISIVAGFNKAISGGGYGPLVTSGQIMSGSDVKNSVGVTQFSECILSALAFLIYFILNDFVKIIFTIQLALIMVISGAFAAPIGALVAKRLKESVARKIVGISSMTLGMMTILRILLL
jgi:uncharacterized membrane protein YfcA